MFRSSAGVVLLFVISHIHFTIGQTGTTTDVDFTGTTGCEFGGVLYNHLDVLPGCMEAICNMGNWFRSENTNSACCLEEGENYYDDLLYFNEDCTGYICQSGQSINANQSDPRCCSDASFQYSRGNDEWYSLEDEINDDYCLLYKCVNREYWQYSREDPTCCRVSYGWYPEGSLRYFNTCYLFTCSNASWIQTNETNPYCCYSPDYYYDSFDSDFRYTNYRLNETIVAFDCLEVSCVSFQTWELTGDRAAGCYSNNSGEIGCELDGVFYNHTEKLPGCGKTLCNMGSWLLIGNQTSNCCHNYDGLVYFKEDCTGHVCQNGIEIETNASDPRCCRDRNIWKYEDEESVSWFTLGKTITVRERWNNYDGSLFCDFEQCTNRFTWSHSSETTNECCSGYRNYNGGQWSYEGSLSYDYGNCTGIICSNGTWLPTNRTYPYCCHNADGYTGFPDPETGLIQDYYTLHETMVMMNCHEVMCSSYETWTLTGNIAPQCLSGKEGCEFNGKSYNESERLPGCMKVYCVQGNWLQKGYIDPDCSKCFAQWDPHLKTFDGYHYDYHGDCSYALAQEGPTENPQYGVSSEFYTCWGNGACVGPSTFKDSSNTSIVMGLDGRNVPQLYQLYVNGVSYTVPDDVPTLVKEGDFEHPVFAWRYGYGCIRLLGSSGLAVQKCGSSLNIWASDGFHNSLYGLCGFFDGNESNDFTKRDGSVVSLKEYPSGAYFPNSWEITCPLSTQQDADASSDGGCSIDETTDTNLRLKCNETITAKGDSMDQDDISVLIDNCFFDLCTISTNTSGNSSALDEWLGEVSTTMEQMVDVVNKTTENDTMPDPIIYYPSPSQFQTSTTWSQPTTSQFSTFSARSQPSSSLFPTFTTGSLGPSYGNSEGTQYDYNITTSNGIGNTQRPTSPLDPQDQETEDTSNEKKKSSNIFIRIVQRIVFDMREKDKISKDTSRN